MAKWNINLNNLGTGGFAPAYYRSTYPSYGNANQAGAMLNCDLRNPNSVTQGPGYGTYTNGTQAGAVSTLIRGILNNGAANSIHYAVGGNQLYQVNALTTTIVDDATWPHAIDKGAVTGETGEDVCLYKGVLYYSYNHSGSAGDIGKYDLASTFDDDWGSTVPTGAAALQDGSHQMIVGGNDTMYIANGQYVASYNGTTFVPQALDLPTGASITSLAWKNDRLWISAVTNNYTSFQKKSSIYVWDGTTDSWESEIKVAGHIGALYVKDGVLYVFYADNLIKQKLAYVNGLTLVALADTDESSASNPSFYYQVTDFDDFLMFVLGQKIYVYGVGNDRVPARLYQYATGSINYIGGISYVGANGLVAAGDSGTFTTQYFTGLDNTGNWKSLMFDVTHLGRQSKIDFVRINTEVMASGARCDWKLLSNNGTTIHSETISYAKHGTQTSFWFPINGKVADNFRIEFDWTNGSTSNPVRIKSARIYGSAD